MANSIVRVPQQTLPGDKLIDNEHYTVDGNEVERQKVALYQNQDGDPLSVVRGLVPYAFDHVTLIPNGNNPTSIEYRTGGAGGTLVATLTITYDGSEVATIGRT